MLPREVIRQIRRLQLTARRAVEDLLGGEYHCVFKGTGIAFEEVREYQPGDDIRTIDWNVTARMGHPFIKRFIEERELTVLLVVDCSGSHQFGTRAAAETRGRRRAGRRAGLQRHQQQRPRRPGAVHRSRRAFSAAAQGHAPRAAPHPRRAVLSAGASRHLPARRISTSSTVSCTAAPSSFS